MNNVNKDRDALKRLRRICRPLPEAVETSTFGHPTFQAGKKRTFVVLDDHEQEDMLCVVFKANVQEQAMLVDDRRFFRSKFGARHGWTAMKVDARTDWGLAERLIRESYRRVALKRMIVALDAAKPRGKVKGRGRAAGTTRRPAR
jgi:predicted DNA-binding protein (MmcQ/YjbR family)